MYQVIKQTGKGILEITDFQRSDSYVNFSMIRELEQSLVLKNFSIKYVLEGRENYFINGNSYAINSGQYLLTNAKCEGKVTVDSKKIVKGICIDISRELFTEVLSTHLRPDVHFNDSSLGNFLNTEQFLENRFNCNNTNLGILLSEIGRKLNTDPLAEYTFDKEFYFTLSEQIIEDYKLIFNQIHGIKSIKTETRKDLFRKLNKGKELMDDNFHKRLHMKDVAQFCSLSEYHFFRLFKAAYKITPQQYLINVRLEKALKLLRSGNHSVSETAIAIGFTDIYSFSKAFKKHFGVSPQNHNLINS